MSDPIAPTVSPRRERLPSIDILRGFVMAIMALDHVRDYFSIHRVSINWMDPTETRPSMFLTRFLAQMCAPAFFLLAGMGVFLSLSGGKPKGKAARHLATRGLLLILLDLTLVRIAWDFNLRFEDGLWFIVLTCLGASMIILAGLIFLRSFWVLVFSLAVIAGSNLLDPPPEPPSHPTAPAMQENETREDLDRDVEDDPDSEEMKDAPKASPPKHEPPKPPHWGRFEPLYTLLHSRDGGTILGVDFYVTYSLFPWVGIMTLGYGLGPMLRWDARFRRRGLFLVGLGFFLTFVVLRALRLYGDPRPWEPNADNPMSYLAFFRTKKYPTSFQHVLLMVGILLMALAFLDRIKEPNALGRWFVQFGRAPLFFYILHVYVLHALQVLIGWAQGFSPWEFLVMYSHSPKAFGFGLPMVFVIWLVVLGICFPICTWFDRVKRRNPGSVWLSYL